MTWDQAVSLAPVGISFVLAYIGIKLDEENAPIKVFFILLSLWVLVISMANLSEIATNYLGDTGIPTDVVNNLDRGYTALMWSAIIGTIYFIIIFLKNLLQWFASFGGARKIW